MSKEDANIRNRGYQDKQEDKRLWGILIFGLIGATTTVFAVTQLRTTVNWIYTQLSRSQSSWKCSTGRSSRTNFQEEAWRRYNRRMQEEYEEEMERVERIRRMQSVFNRERNKFRKSYERWTENDSTAYHQHFQRDDWYWKADTSYRDEGSNFREIPRASARASLSHHYSVLGLDRLRTKPYTDEEIKAMRKKIKLEPWDLWGDWIKIPLSFGWERVQGNIRLHFSLTTLLVGSGFFVLWQLVVEYSLTDSLYYCTCPKTVSKITMFSSFFIKIRYN